ncbi:MAG: hypothetical protein FJ098_09585, partial [Deltaproteobacteria bacterium]|nr:hypothetical protein [Deltaproteobacteria bacterium]
MTWLKHHPRVLLLAGLMALSAGLYGSSLGNAWVLDDQPAVVENPCAAWPPDLGCIATTNFWGDRPHYRHLTIYRPLATLSFALVDGLVPEPELGPAIQRGVNILLHGLVSWLVALLVIELLGGLGAAWATGALFALHPVHTEAVLGVVSRTELLAAAFVLLAVLNHRGWSREEGAARRALRGGTALLLVALAVLSKESGATLVGGLLVVDAAAAVGRRRGWTGHRVPAPWWVHAGGLLLLAGYLLLRARVLPGILAGDLNPYDNPLAAADPAT